MGMQINSLLEGEVYSVTEGSGVTTPISYTVNTRLPDGSQVFVPNVIVACMLGGVDDFSQRRLRCSLDAGGYDTSKDMDGQYRANVGDRVIVSLLGGNLRRPIIVGFLPHPNQVLAISDTTKPQSISRYLGYDVSVDPDGQVEVTHNGAPTITPVSKGAGLPSLASISGGSSVPTSDAVETQGNDVICKMNFDKLGSWRVRDSLGQMIEVNKDKGRIYIANNSIKSTDPQSGDAGLQISTNSTNSEYVLLDRDKELVLINARSIIQLYSFDRRKDVTDGDHSHKIGGDEKITIAGTKTDDIKGSLIQTIGGDVSQEVKGMVELTVDGATTYTFKDDFGLVVSGAINGEAKSMTMITDSSYAVECGPTKLNITPGKFEVVTAMGGVIENIVALIDTLLKATYLTKDGPTSTAVNNAEILAIQTKFKGMIP